MRRRGNEEKQKGTSVIGSYRSTQRVSSNLSQPKCQDMIFFKKKEHTDDILKRLSDIPRLSLAGRRVTRERGRRRRSEMPRKLKRVGHGGEKNVLAGRTAVRGSILFGFDMDWDSSSLTVRTRVLFDFFWDDVLGFDLVAMCVCVWRFW